MSFFEAIKIEWNGAQFNVKQACACSVDEAIVSKETNSANDIVLALSPRSDYEKQIAHRDRKAALRQGRLEVLRIIICRYLKSTDREVEKYIDGLLIQHNYDLEKAIDYYRNIAPEAAIDRLICDKCRYRPLFCTCKEA